MQTVKPRLCLLGQPRLEQAGQVVILPLDRILWLLTLIALPGGWVRRSTVANLIWDDGDSDTVAKRLRQLLYRAKNLGFGEGLEADAGRLRWVGTCDLLEWRAAVQTSDEERAIELASGELLSGVLADSTEFGAWLELERQSFLQSHQQLTLRYATRLERDRQYLSAYNALERCVQIVPIEEPLLLEALRLAGLADAGQRGLALFELHKKALLEIGLAPSPVLLAVAQQLEQPRAVITASLPHLTQPLFGRERELAAVAAWIVGDARLLSLVGVGGIGKTSLAVKGLRHAQAVFVPLSGFTGSSLTSSVATALGAVLPGQADAGVDVAPTRTDAAAR
jgi:DNA-binding SARP family transcriptional activator